MWLVGLCLLLGMAVARWGKAPVGMAAALHWWIIYVALPAVTLALVPRLRLSWELWYLAASQWLVLGVAVIWVSLASRRLGWTRARTGCIMLVAGLSNTSFLGFPMIEALRGGASLPLAVVADQAGAFLALAIGGTMIAATFATGDATSPRPTGAQIARRVATFPPFLALVAGVVVGLAGGWPPQLAEVFARLGGTLSPLALFSVGLHFKLRLRREQAFAVAAALAYKLALAPALVWSVGMALGLGGELLAIATLQAAMSPMISATIVADKHGLDPDTANTVLGFGIVASIATLPLINALLG
ncbi:MAG: AEC family transporter [Myxococcales bacterium]|nr:AEC family transporter [Myxococcales bacterium]